MIAHLDRRMAGLTLVLLLINLFLVSCQDMKSEQEVRATSFSRCEISPSAKAILMTAEGFELLALHPNPMLEEGSPASGEDFHGYKVLGRSPVTDAERLQVLELVGKGVIESDGRAAKCFMPRHGIRSTMSSDGGRAVVADLVICYECFQIYVYLDGQRIDQVTTSQGVQPAVDTLYRKVGLTIHRN